MNHKLEKYRAGQMWLFPVFICYRDYLQGFRYVGKRFPEQGGFPVVLPGLRTGLSGEVGGGWRPLLGTISHSGASGCVLKSDPQHKLVMSPDALRWHQPLIPLAAEMMLNRYTREPAENVQQRKAHPCR